MSRVLLVQEMYTATTAGTVTTAAQPNITSRLFTGLIAQDSQGTNISFENSNTNISSHKFN